MICPICQTRYAPFPKDDFKYEGDRFLPIKEGALERRRRAYSSNQQNGGCEPECRIILRRMLSAYDARIRRGKI